MSNNLPKMDAYDWYKFTEQCKKERNLIKFTPSGDWKLPARIVKYWTKIRDVTHDDLKDMVIPLGIMTCGEINDRRPEPRRKSTW
ncbi:MAG: hypothetical protein NC548_47085 [Lachnospiraceae bacterium]|nr:hypothetical protein [Lachnospiraceae bacterium]